MCGEGHKARVEKVRMLNKRIKWASSYFYACFVYTALKIHDIQGYVISIRQEPMRPYSQKKIIKWEVHKPFQ